ncbi:unnamed protein product [Rhodiola kirilowii]
MLPFVSHKNSISQTHRRNLSNLHISSFTVSSVRQPSKTHNNMDQGDNDDVSETVSPAPKKNSKKPKYSRFTQQELPACKPIVTPGLVVTTFLAIGIIFIPIGLASLSASERVVEIVDHYEKGCLPENIDNPLAYIQDPKTDKSCKRTLRIPKSMKSPIYVYYELHNLYQNHRRYVKSRNDKQLKSAKYETSSVSSCEPEAYANGKAIVPCGLVAWSLFNDTYHFSIDEKAIQLNRKNIAWESDKTGKFGSDVYPKNFQSVNSGLIGGGRLNESLPLSDQEDLIVWMRTAAFPNFRKLYGRIEMDLEANKEIQVLIQNNYNTYSFGGQKKLVLSTTTWIGGRNDSLGVAYVAVGALCLLVGLSFVVMYMLRPRPLGDPSFLSWNKNPAGYAN